MLILFRPDASSTDEQRVIALVQELGLEVQPIAGLRRRAVAILGNDGRVDGARFSALPGVEEIVPLISRFANSQNKVSEADLRANDPFHVEVESLSRTVWAPAVHDATRQRRLLPLPSPSEGRRLG